MDVFRRIRTDPDIILMDDTVCEKLLSTHWKVVPPDWRPGEIWYRLKCFLWHRYTTIRPRTMPWHTWTDRCELLPHLMFEVLTQFIEKECSPGIIDWDASDRRIEVNGTSVNVRHEMQELYDWWHEVYLRGKEISITNYNARKPILRLISTQS